MKKINKFIVGFTLLLSISNEALAGNIGYVWILSIGKTYDDIGINPKHAYILRPHKSTIMPEVNSIIRIEPKNRIYWDLGSVQDITDSFISLIKEKKCPNMKGTLRVYMLNEDEQCSVDKVIDKIEESTYGSLYYPRSASRLFYELRNPIKARVLGYVGFKAGVFVLIEQIEVLKKDK